MVKKYNNFINEGNDSHNVIDAKMQELSDLIKNSSNGTDLMYQWEGNDENELVVNFVIDEKPIRFEFELDDLFLMKIVGSKIDYSEKVSSVDAGLSMIEKDIQDLVGILENINKNMKHLKKFESFLIKEEKENTPKDKKLWNKALRLAKGTKHGGSASVRVDGESIEAPNDGKGFDVYPSAYANSYAAKMYKKWGGKWKTNEDLRDWHKEKWVRIDTQGNIAGECGSMPDGKSMQRCLPKKKAKSMTKAERKATTAKKVKGDKKGKQFVSNTKKAKVSK